VEPTCGRAAGSKDSTKNLNAYLDTLQEKVYEIKRKLIDRSKPITAFIIRDTLSGRKIYMTNPGCFWKYSSTITTSLPPWSELPEDRQKMPAKRLAGS